MANNQIAQAFDRTERALRRRPTAGVHDDSPAVARWDGGARLFTSDPHGHGLATDLPRLLGGDEAGPPPGWLLRAGLAACLATCVAAVAAREGVELTALEVEARSRSDVRGLVGLPGEDGAPVDPGPSELELVVRVAAADLAPEALAALVDRANAISPVSAALQFPRPVAVRIEAAS
jgi:uncharacterized OsmC-like protein